MLIKVGIDQGQRQSVAVPESAVQFEGTQASVFLIAQGPKGKIARRTTVQTGLSSDGYVEIVSGLKAGDHIVGDGLNRIQDGAPSAAATARAVGRAAPEEGRLMLSDLSVRRPVFAAVVAIILCVIGLAAFSSLAIRELPNVDPPVVSISTTYRGASAEVIEERITQVIERQVAGIQGIDRVNSSSRDGRSQITITFTLDRDLDAAANDVRDAVSRVTSNLPDQADPPQIAKAQADSSPIVILNLTSTTLSPLELADYADRYLVERMSTVPGVAQAGLNGQLYAMRIWLNPDAMAARRHRRRRRERAQQPERRTAGRGPGKRRQGFHDPRGPQLFAARGLRETAAARGRRQRLRRPPGRRGARGGGSNERRKIFRGNGADQVGIFLTRQSQANDVAISKVVDKELLEINKTLPPGTQLIKAVDNSIFTAEAIHEVWVTMGISIGLVALVNLVFLGSWRSALIPSIVAPICILSTFIVLAPLGFSLNLLTLLALVLAVGLVVDDAIVVVENIQRRVDEGEPANVAALRGTRQVFFAVVATTIVLISVFAPLMFLPGYIGRLFVELAVAIAAAVGFSALLALSLSPMLASKLLKPASGGSWFNRKVDHAMDRLKDSYRHSLERLLAARSASVGAGLVVLFLAAGGGRPVRGAAAGAGAGRGSRPRRHLDQRPRGRGLRLHRQGRQRRREGAGEVPRRRRRRADHHRRAALWPEPVQHRQRRAGAQGLGRTRQDRRPGGG
jgi:multidrug efflux pump